MRIVQHIKQVLRRLCKQIAQLQQIGYLSRQAVSGQNDTRSPRTASVSRHQLQLDHLLTNLIGSHWLMHEGL